jgi:hypothetical protein
MNDWNWNPYDLWRPNCLHTFALEELCNLTAKLTQFNLETLNYDTNTNTYW